MGFDRNRVQFNEEDLNAGESLDRIYETFKRSGLSFELLGDARNLLHYVLDNDRKDVADRLLALSMMFTRDNVDLSDVELTSGEPE